MIVNAVARPRVTTLPNIDVKAIWRVARWVVLAVWISGMTDDCPAIEAANQHAASIATSHPVHGPEPIGVRR